MKPNTMPTFKPKPWISTKQSFNFQTNIMLTFQWSALHSFYGLCMQVAQPKKSNQTKYCYPSPRSATVEALLVRVWAVQWNLWRHIKKFPKVVVAYSYMVVWQPYACMATLLCGPLKPVYLLSCMAAGSGEFLRLAVCFPHPKTWISLQKKKKKKPPP